jgi:hypothetical protein
VPYGATTGPIPVTTAGGTATSVTSFTVNPCPSTQTAIVQTAVPAIRGVKPQSGKAGTTVTIPSTSLVGAFKVPFAGVKASFKLDSTARIIATVPKKGKVGQDLGDHLAGTSTSSASFRGQVELRPFRGVDGTYLRKSRVAQ